MSVPMSEAQFVSWIVDLATLHGWKVHHVPFPARQIGGGRLVAEPRAAGFPDLILARDRTKSSGKTIIFAEVKGEKGKVGEEQWAWIDLLSSIADGFQITPEREADFIVRLWRPSDRADIEKMLR